MDDRNHSHDQFFVFLNLILILKLGVKIEHIVPAHTRRAEVVRLLRVYYCRQKMQGTCTQHVSQKTCPRYYTSILCDAEFLRS